MENAARLRRWRLILGQEGQKRIASMGGCALAAIYNRADSGGFGMSTGGGGGKGPSNPQISKWLGDVRSLFDKDLVKVIQGDAMERCGLKQLLFEPELLDNLEPDINLASTIMLLKEQIPKRLSAKSWRRSTGCWSRTFAGPLRRR